MKLPQPRIKNIIVQHLGKELLVYDLTINKAYCLNETSAIVYNACGKNTFDELNKSHNYTDDLIYLALDELKKQNLIEDNSFVSPLVGMSRREVIRKVGLASVAALPLIASLAAPTAANAQSRPVCVNQSGPQRAKDTFLGYRSIEFCANDAVTCCSNSTRFDTSNCREINNVTHQVGCTCYCN